MTFPIRLRYFLFAAIAMSAGHTAIALSPMMATVKLDIPFAVGSSVLPEVSAIEIAEQAACMETIALEVVIIQTTGDSSSANVDGASQLRLAAERANAVRASFLRIGVPDWRIYAEASATVRSPGPYPPLGPAQAVARVEYTGTCIGSGNCQIMCKVQRQ